MSDKPSTASSSSPADKENKNMPVAAGTGTKKSAADASQTAPSSSSSVAIIAALISIVTAGGAFVLWKEVTSVQQTVANSVGIDQSDLDKLQKSLEQSIATTTSKTASELKNAVVETKGLLEKQISESTSKVASEAATVKSEAKESISSIENAIVETKATVQQSRTEVENIINSTKGEIQKEFNQAISTTSTEISSTKEELAEVKGSFGELQQQIAERLKSAEEAQASLHADVQESQSELKHALSRNRTDWAVAEIEHILRLANEQVQLEQNVAKAITTLRTADQRLQSLTDPALMKVREVLEQDIASLSIVEVPNITETALTLGRLSADAQQLQTISLSDKTTKATEIEKDGEISTAAEIAANNSLLAVKGFATAAFEGIGGLVVVKKDDKAMAPLIPPGQAYFVKQNLQLKLETARLALLKQDDKTFHDAINTAIAWSEQYFSKDAPTTQKFLDELSKLGKLNIAPTLPDISGSLKALREVQPNLS